MGNLQIKIDLAKLNGAKRAKANGVEGIFIPTAVNKEIYIGQKGAYLNLTAIELRNPSQFGDTHLVKGNLPREVFDAMTEEQRKAQPILGNAKPLTSAAPTPPAAIEETIDDLPW